MADDAYIGDPLLPTEATWAGLMAEANLRGYEVRLVEWVECADTPGLLGQANGSIHYASKVIRVKASLSEAHRIQTLEHEIEHARDPDNGKAIDKAWYERRVAALADELEGH